MNEQDYEARFPETPRRVTIGKILKWIFLLLIVLLFGFVGLRSCTMRGRASMKAYLWTEKAIGASKEDGFRVYELSEHNKTTISSTFIASKIYYTEPIGQLQFLLSYNKSMLNLVDTYKLAEAPTDTDTSIVFALIDEDGNAYRDYVFVTDSLFRNNFFRLVFEDLPFDEDSSYTLYAYYLDAPEGKDPRFDSIPVYRFNFYKEPIKVKVPSSAAEVRVPAETAAISVKPEETDAQTGTN